MTSDASVRDEFIKIRGNLSLKVIDCEVSTLAKGLSIVLPYGPCSLFHLMLDLDDYKYVAGAKQPIGRCSVSNELLAELLGVSARTVAGWIKDLETEGLVLSYRENTGSPVVKYWSLEPIARLQQRANERLKALNIPKSFRTPSDFEATVEDQTPETNATAEEATTIDPRKNRAYTLSNKYRDNSNNHLLTTSIAEAMVDEKQGISENPSKEIIPAEDETLDPTINVAVPELADLDTVLPENPGVVERNIPVLSKRERKDKERLAKELETGLTVDGLYSLFNRVYREVFEVPYYDPLAIGAKSRCSIKKGFLEKYPKEKQAEIVRTFIQNYKNTPGVDTPEHPLPTMRQLTLPWLINLVLEHSKRTDEIKNQAAEPEAIPLDPFDPACTTDRIFCVGSKAQEYYEMFYLKYHEGKLNGKPWLVSMDYPLDDLIKELENA